MRSAHLDEHLPVLLQPVLKQRDKLVLVLYERLEDFEGPRYAACSVLEFLSVRSSAFMWTSRISATEAVSSPSF